jgi:hypothetical protein
LRQCRAIEPHRAARRRPDANDGAYQAGLAGAARPDDAERFARLEPEVHVGDDRLVAARDNHGDLLDIECARGRGSSVAAAGADCTRVKISDSRLTLCRAEMSIGSQIWV